jgi:hypothetical protein
MIVNVKIGRYFRLIDEVKRLGKLRIMGFGQFGLKG